MSQANPTSQVYLRVSLALLLISRAASQGLLPVLLLLQFVLLQLPHPVHLSLVLSLMIQVPRLLLLLLLLLGRVLLLCRNLLLLCRLVDSQLLL